MNNYFSFHQEGTGNPSLSFVSPQYIAISCARVADGIYVFTLDGITDYSKVALFISPMEVENQTTGDPVVAHVVNQGDLRVIGRDPSGVIVDFNMTTDVFIPMKLVIYP